MRGRAIILSVCLSGLLGCQCFHKPASATQPSVSADRLYEPSHTSALAFSPPIAQADAPLDLTRADREPAAFVGYDDLIRTYIYVRTDDRWTGDGTGNYERRAIIEKVGASTR
jgi:hypothetical protein